MRQLTPLQYCLIGCVGFVFLSSVVFWIVELRDRDQHLPDLPELPQQAEQPQPQVPTPKSTPAATTPRRRIRAGVNAEIALLEQILSEQKKQEAGREQQRLLLIEALKKYAALAAKAEANPERDLAFLRLQNAEIAPKLATLTESVATAEKQRNQVRDSLKQAEEALRSQKEMLNSEVGTLETATKVNDLQRQLATVEIRVAIDSDALAWWQAQQEASAKASMGTPEAVLLAVDVLAKWQPPRNGIAVLELQLDQLRGERELLEKK